jgi:hypothetical protein
LQGLHIAVLVVTVSRLEAGIGSAVDPQKVTKVTAVSSFFLVTFFLVK